MALDELDAGQAFQAHSYLALADGTNQKTLLDARQFCSAVQRITFCSNAATSHVINFRTSNTPQTQVASLTIPAGVGFGGVAPVDGLAAILGPGRTFLRLARSEYIYVQLDAALLAGEYIVWYVELTGPAGSA